VNLIPELIWPLLEISAKKTEPRKRRQERQGLTLGGIKGGAVIVYYQDIEVIIADLPGPMQMIFAALSIGLITLIFITLSIYHYLGKTI
jgi:hypothetical protein